MNERTITTRFRVHIQHPDGRRGRALWTVADALEAFALAEVWNAAQAGVKLAGYQPRAAAVCRIESTAVTLDDAAILKGGVA